MDPLAASLITSGSQLLGGWMSSNAQGAANQQSTANQYQQQAFEQLMSNTAYQRATADMKKAGINPMLAYMQGGASTPSAPQSANIQPVDALGKAVSNIGSSALQSAQNAQMINKVKTDVDVNKSQVNQNKANMINQLANARKVAAEADNQIRQNFILESNTPNIIKKSSFEGAKAEVMSTPTLLWLDSVMSSILPGAQSASALAAAAR